MTLYRLALSLLMRLALVLFLLPLCSCSEKGSSPQPRLLDSPAGYSRIEDPELARLAKLQSLKGRMRLHGCFLEGYPAGTTSLIKYVDDLDAECNCILEDGECTGVYPCAEGSTFGEAVECRQSDWFEWKEDSYDPPPSFAEILNNALSGICLEQATCGGPVGSSPACVVDACSARFSLCKANAALELTGLHTRPIEMSYTLPSDPDRVNLVELRIPAQSTETRAAIAERAREYSKDAARKVLQALHSAALLGTVSECAGEDLNQLTVDGRTAASELGANLKEAYDVYREATLRSVDLNVGSADKQRSNPVLSVAVERQQVDPRLSRAYAATLLVGGDPTLDETPLATGLCTQPELSGGGRRALQLFRMAGMCPADIKAIPGEVQDGSNIVPIENLLTGTLTGSGYPQSGSLLQRFVQQRNVDSDYDFFETHGVRTEHFVEARAYLAEELRAFGRDDNANLPDFPYANPPADPEVAPFPVFAATATEPHEPDPGYYASLVRYAAGDPRTGGGSYTAPTDVSELEAVDNLADFADITLGLASQALAAGLNADVGPTAELEATLGYFKTAGNNDVQGRFVVCPEGNDLRASVYGVEGLGPNDNLLVAAGKAGLECATEGSVDGGPCTLVGTDGAVSDLVAFQLNQPAALAVDYPAGATASRPFSEVAERLYLVKPKGGGATPGPGDYELLSVGNRTDNQVCIVSPIYPTAISQAGRLLTPSPEWCSHPQVECDGSLFDERIPLEDELSDDGDGVESSWKHYLALAKQSAAEADLLAQEYVQAGLDLDIREESIELREQANEVAAVHELGELQRICGTNLDPDTVLALLRVDDEGSDFTTLVTDPEGCDFGEPCSCSDGANSCGAGRTCIAGKCFESPIEGLDGGDLQIGRLLACLGVGQDSVYQAVTPGDIPVCYWRSADDPNVICRDDAYVACMDERRQLGSEATCAAQRNACPFPASDTMFIGGEGFGCSGEGPGGEPLEMSDMTLNYFTNERTPLDAIASDDGEDPAPVVSNSARAACNKLMQARQTLDRAERASLVAELRRVGPEEFFQPYNVAEVAAGVEFEASADTRFSLKLGGRLYHTGSLESGIEPGPLLAGWPCTDEFACSDTYSESLLCQPIPCSDEVERGFLADRVRDAVVTLNVLSNQVRVPGAGRLPAGLSRVELFDPARGAIHDNVALALPASDIRPTSKLDCERVGVAGGIGWQKCWHAPGAYTVWYNEVPEQRLWFFSDTYGTYPGDPNVGIHVRAAKTVFLGNLYDWTDGGRLVDWTGWWRGLSSAVDEDGPTPIMDCLAGDSCFVDNISYEEQDLGVWKLDRALGSEAVLDAVELYCMARAGGAGLEGGVVGCTGANITPVSANSLDGLEDIAESLVCTAQEVERAAANTLFFNFPTQAADALRAESAVGAFPELGGELASAITRLRATLVELQAAGPLVASHINQLGLDVHKLTLELRGTELEQKINSKLAEKERLAQVGRCHEALVSGMAGAANDKGAGLATATAVCMNSAIQMGLIGELEALQTLATQNGVELDLARYRGYFEERAMALAQIATDIASAQERLDGTLAEIENLRFAAQTAFDNAVWLSSFQAGQQFNINSAMRRRFNTVRVRYEEAHKYAQRMAFLARRSIEARLGVRLESMSEPLPLVGAPQTWANDVCSTEPIDYRAVREELDDPQDEGANYAGAFIGSYVRNLEAVVESYRLVNNFHEGVDTSVVSLRDDIFRVTSPCERPSVNLLASSGQFERGAVWVRSGCEKDSDGVATENCARAEEALEPPPGLEAVASAYLFTFGHAPIDGDVVPCDASCGLTADVRWGQQVALQPGEYLLSWYAAQVQPGGTADPVNPTGENSVVLSCPDGYTMDAAAVPVDPVPDSDWVRYTARVSLDEADGRQDCTVSVVPDGAESHQVIVAGLMLERAEEKNLAGKFRATSVRGTVIEPACEDSTGTTFRSVAWSERECVLLCGSGFSGDCSETLAEEYCYREASFTVDQTDIEQGGILRQAGIALGNFNYRIETVALNFVGTDTRNCEGSDLPQTCYSAGFVPYSIVHRGPYHVRNHDGDLFEVPLFTGNIEHARGLATERYISNPMSDADRSLIEPYTRYEFQGRPLDGNFVVRVWDDDGFDFGQIQDVQLILNYRYWTRFD